MPHLRGKFYEIIQSRSNARIEMRSPPFTRDSGDIWVIVSEIELQLRWFFVVDTEPLIATPNPADKFPQHIFTSFQVFGRDGRNRTSDILLCKKLFQTELHHDKKKSYALHLLCALFGCGLIHITSQVFSSISFAISEWTCLLYGLFLIIGKFLSI